MRQKIKNLWIRIKGELVFRQKWNEAFNSKRTKDWLNKGV